MYLCNSELYKEMNHDIHQQVSQRGDGAQDAENRRIAEIADELDRLCRVHEAESGSGEADVKHHELEQRAAEQMAKARGFWFPMMDVVRLGVPGLFFSNRGLPTPDRQGR